MFGSEPTSIPSIMLSELCERFFPYRSTASARPTTCVSLAVSSRLSMRQPFPETTSCSSCISSSPPSPSRKVAHEPLGKTRGKLRRDLGKLV